MCRRETNSVFFLKCFPKRVREREVLRNQVDRNVPEESTQMINMSNQAPTQTQIENVSPNPSNTIFVPSAPNMSVDSNMSSAHVISNVMNMKPAQMQPRAAGPHVNQATYVSDCR